MLDAGYIAREIGQEKWPDVAGDERWCDFKSPGNKGDERRLRRGNSGGGQRRYTDIEVMFWLARARPYQHKRREPPGAHDGWTGGQWNFRRGTKSNLKRNARMHGTRYVRIFEKPVVKVRGGIAGGEWQWAREGSRRSARGIRRPVGARYLYVVLTREKRRRNAGQWTAAKSSVRLNVPMPVPGNRIKALARRRHGRMAETRRHGDVGGDSDNDDDDNNNIRTHNAPHDDDMWRRIITTEY